MYSLKEKLTEKVSSYKSRGNPLSSFISSFILPPTNVDEHAGYSLACQQEATSPQEDCDGPFSDRSSKAKEKTEDTIEPRKPVNPSPDRISKEEEKSEDTIEPQKPVNPMPNLTEDSSFVSPELYKCLCSSIPNIVKGCQWVLLYSTLKHGTSLRTLIRKSADLPGPGLLIVGDKKGAVFGGLIDCPLKPSPKRKYQGTSQTFVFTTVYGEPRLFRPTGANRFFYLCLNDLVAFGGGGNFALSLEGDLLTGTSGPCQTFGCGCLASESAFELKNVELWGFTHASRYLS